MSNFDSNDWEPRLEAKLRQHGVRDPARVVARWKRHRETAIMRALADARRQLAAAQATTAPATESNHVSDSGICQDERLVRALDRTHRQMVDSESRLLAVLRERSPVAGLGQEPTTSGLGSVIVFGGAVAVVVVTLVLTLYFMLGSIEA